MSNLEKMCVLVTRPELQGKNLCEKIHELGGVAVHFPTIEFLPLQNKIEWAEPYDWIIFISREAVTQSVSRWPVFPEKTRIAALGAGTADLLHAKGIKNVIYPEQEWTSEGLLALPVLNELQHQKILLVRGEGGREMLGETLAARGAIVSHWIVYRRVLPMYSDIESYRELFRQKKIDIIVCASGESMRNLMTLIGMGSLLYDVDIVVVSSRLVLLAKELHFQKIFQAENASDSAMIDTLRFIKGKNYVR